MRTRLLAYLYRNDIEVGYAWIYVNRDICQTILDRMQIFRDAAKRDGSLNSLVYNLDGLLDPTADFLLCDHIDDLDGCLSNGACISSVESHVSPAEEFAASVDEDGSIDDEIEEMLLDDEMELRTVSSGLKGDQFQRTKKYHPAGWIEISYTSACSAAGKENA